MTAASAPDEQPDLTKCIHCGCFINPALGKDSLAEHEGKAGTEDDPRSPGASSC